LGTAGGTKLEVMFKDVTNVDTKCTAAWKVEERPAMGIYVLAALNARN